MTTQPKKPWIDVEQLDGNIFSWMAATRRALRRAGQGDKVEEMLERVQSSGGYDNAMAILLDYVEFGPPDDEDEDEGEDAHCPECGGPRDNYPWYNCTNCSPPEEED